MVASLGDATGPSLGDPLGATSSPVEVRGVAVSREVAADSEMEKMEKKLTDLKANLVEKCQSSKT